MVEVSIIIPVFNAVRWLPSCLDSVLRQNLDSVEVLCVDDCSTDGSVAVIQRYAQGDSRIKLIKLSKHVSTGEVRNTGMAQAAGRYVAFMDADDLYPNRDTLKRMLTATEMSGCHLGCGYAVCFTNDDPDSARNGKPCIGHPGPSGIVSYRQWQDVRGFCTCLYEKKFLTDNGLTFPRITRNEDPVFFMNVLLTAGRFYALGECTYLYRTSHKSVDWEADDFRLKREHVGGLLDMLSRAHDNRLDKLETQMVRELAGAIDTVRCFRSLRELGDKAIQAIRESNVLCDTDRNYVYHWMARRERLWIRLLFVATKFGALRVLTTLWRHRNKHHIAR